MYESSDIYEYSVTLAICKDDDTWWKDEQIVSFNEEPSYGEIWEAASGQFYVPYIKTGASHKHIVAVGLVMFERLNQE